MNIKIDGDHNLHVSGEGRVAILVSGVTGGATMQLTYEAESPTHGFIALTDGLLTVNNQYVVDKGENTSLHLTVTGATGTTDLDVQVGAL